MSARVGFVGGLLILTATEAVLSSQQATGRVSGVFTGVGKLFSRIADPTVPAIPDLRPAGAQTSTSAATSSGGVVPTRTSTAPSITNRRHKLSTA